MNGGHEGASPGAAEVLKDVKRREHDQYRSVGTHGSGRSNGII